MLLELAAEGALQPGRPVAILDLVVHGAKAVPGVSASFDVLEAGDMVEGCSIWVSVRLGAVRTVAGLAAF